MPPERSLPPSAGAPGRAQNGGRREGSRRPPAVRQGSLRSGRPVAALVLLARTARAGRVARRTAADRLARRGAPGPGGGRRGGTGTAYPAAATVAAEPERGCLFDLRGARSGGSVDRR